MLMVSGIMPARGRCDWAAQAVACFLSQTYPEKRLVILDDGDCPAFPQGISHTLVDYHCTNGRIRYSVPEKRNQLTRLAAGDILMNFDSDDFSAPERMADQVQRLEESGKPLTGYTEILWYAEGDAQPWRRYTQVRDWVGGSSMAFRRDWALSHPFNEMKRTGSDSVLQREARRTGDIVSVPAGEMLCARIHGDNTSPKRLKAFAPVDEPASEWMRAWAGVMALG